MTTTTRKTLERDKVADEPLADPAVEQQGNAMGVAQLVTRKRCPIHPNGRHNMATDS